MSRSLVGAPHPLSNIRPVIYNGRAPLRQLKNIETVHPYSLEEFEPSTSRLMHAGARREAWNAERQRLDAMNHRFWSNSNRRFQSAEQRLQQRLPQTCSQEDKERTIGQFRLKWLEQESPLQNAYNAELRHQTWKQIGRAMVHVWSGVGERFSMIFRPR